MTINQVKELVGNVVDKNIKTPILLIGQTGIGKSQSIQQLCKDKGIKFIDLRLATQEVSDLIGIPRTQEINGELRTNWTKPCWYPEEGTKGVLALEEVNRAPEDVRQAIFELLTEWKLHTHSLPDGWAIVSMINPDNGNYHVNNLDTAFLRRFIQIAVTPADEVDWSLWAKKMGVNDKLIQFSLQFPQHLGKSEEVSIDAKPTRAGYEMLSKLMNADVIPDKCFHEVATGILGVETATTLSTSFKNNLEMPVKASDILKDYSKVKSKYLEHIKTKKTELIYMTMVDMIANTEDVGKKELTNLCNYLIDSPKEVLVSVILKTNSKVISKIISSNEADDLIKSIQTIQKELDKI